MTQGKSNQKAKKAIHSQKHKPATPAEAEITDPQKVNTEPEQQVIESTNGPVKGTSQDRMTSVQKWTISIMSGLLFVNVLALWAMKEDAKLEKRAWIGLEKPIRRPVKLGEKLSYEIVFTNTGKTPSRGTKRESRIGFDPTDSYMRAFFQKDIPNDPNRGEAPLAPNASIFISGTSKDEASESLFRRIESGETVMFVLVKIEYSDIFDEPHKTHACLRYSPKVQDLVAYYKHNYMD